jgi:hypothetical protein
MTKLETNWYPEVIPGFDALKLKQELQERIYRETEGMTREEIREYLRLGSEKFRAERAQLAESADQ